MKGYDYQALKMLSTGNIPPLVWNQVIDLLASHDIASVSRGRTRTVFGAGTHIELDQTSAGSAAAATVQPFQNLTFTAVQGSTTQWMATFQPGDVNYNIFPKIINLPMWVLQPDPTTGAAPYTFPMLTVNNGDTIYLLGDVSAGLLTNVNIYSSASLPDESDEVTTYIIGTCDPMTGAFTQISVGNLEYLAAATYFSGGDRLIRHEWDVQLT